MSEYRETMSAPVGDLREIREKFWMALEDQPTVMLARLNSGDHAVPMRAQLDRHAHGKFWFFTKRENRCAAGGPAMAQFVGKGKYMFACIAGRLVEETDPSVIDHFWSNPVEAWYPGGRLDPSLLVLRFELDTAEIWEPDLGISGAFKLLTGATIQPGDAGQHGVISLS